MIAAGARSIVRSDDDVMIDGQTVMIGVLAWRAGTGSRIAAPPILDLITRSERIEGARRPADGFGGDPGVARRALQIGVTQQNLDHADLGSVLQKMGSEALPQGVRRHLSGKASRRAGGPAGGMQRGRFAGADSGFRNAAFETLASLGPPADKEHAIHSTVVRAH